MKIFLTIIVPVYNEEESLAHFKDVMKAFLTASPQPAKVLFVNDGSTDGSLKLIQSICQDQQFSYISFESNAGLSAAIKAGIDFCQTEWWGYIDADLQTDPMDFIKYMPYLGSHQMVNGIRAERSDTLIKKMSSKVANSYRRLMINDGIKDTCCPLKIIRTDMAKKVPFFKGMHRFLPALIQLQGGKVKQLEVNHAERYAGTAKYHLFNRLVGPFFDTFAFVWMKKRYITYKVNQQELEG